jgi:hypothetical protein
VPLGVAGLAGFRGDKGWFDRGDWILHSCLVISPKEESACEQANGQQNVKPAGLNP